MIERPVHRLFLFDIDGTLIRTHGAGSRSLARAFQHILRQTPPIDSVPFAGRTDTEIIQDLLHLMGVPEHAREDIQQQLIRAYTTILQRELETHPPEVLPGIPELLQHLHTLPATYLGLVTGNLKTSAYLKLRAAGLADYFPVGSFADDASHRNALPPIAVKRARAYYKLPESVSLDIFVIGDTPRDIQCSRTLPARSVAVCTGPYSRKELEAHNPDFLFSDFQATDTILDTLLKDGATND